MARFYGTMNGGRGTASRTGHKRDGLTAHVRGWNIGVGVWAHPKPLDDENDRVDIRATAGSNGAVSETPIGIIQQNADGSRVFLLSDELAAELQPKYQSARLDA